MTMLERRGRSSSKGTRASRREQPAKDAPPPSTGPDEETVRIARMDFRRRRYAGRWRRARTIVVALLLVAVVSGSVWLVFFSSRLTAREVDVTGTQTLGEARIERAAEVPTGTPLARLDLGAVRARVEALAAVRRAEVSRAWPHTVHIEVLERTPVAVIDRGSGLQALDSEGVLFGSYETRPKHLPLVRTEPDTRGEALLEAGRVISALPPGIARRVDTVEVSSVDEINLVLTNGRRVIWGSAEDSDQKAEVLGVLLRRPGNQIDVSAPGRPTTR
jgi:cell division protein FtsQ